MCRQDVPCEEICVCCHQVSRRVRLFIRHAERHRDAGKTKLTYIDNMCEELRVKANQELETLEYENCSNIDNGVVKRTSHMAEIDMPITRSHRRRRSTSEKTRDNLQLSSAENVSQGLALEPPGVSKGIALMHGPPSNQLVSNQLGDIAGNLAGTNGVSSTFASVQTDMLVANLAQDGAILDDLIFDAPVNGIVNFPNFVEPWPM